MRQRDARFAEQARHKDKPDPLYNKQSLSREHPVHLYRPSDFRHDPISNTCVCPAGQLLYSNGSRCSVNGRLHHKFTGSKSSCGPCAQRSQCLRYPQRTSVRQVAIFARNQSSPIWRPS